MANTKITSGVIADDAITTSAIADDAITAALIADNAVGISALNVSDGSDGQVLTTNGSGTLSFSTISAGVAGISTSADATAITISSSEEVTFSKPTTSDGHTSSVPTIFEGNAGGDTVAVQLKVKANNNTTSTQGLYGNAGSASTDNTITLGTDGTTGLTVNNSGSVGIGTISPSAPFHVDHSSSTAYNGAAEILESVIVRNKNGTDNSGVNNVASIGLQVADGATSQGFLNYVRTGNNIGDFTFSQRTGSSSYAEAMRINNSGQITAPLQPAFDVGKNNGYQTDDNNFIQDQVRTNVGSHYSTSTGRFTAPVAGQYLISFRIFTHDSGGVVQAEVTLKKNGADHHIFRAHKVGGYHTPVQGTKVITLAANDYIQTYVGDSGTSSGWMGSAGEYNYFSGFLIS